MSEAESSGQALERYISEKLLALSLSVPSDDVEFMARFVEEDMEKDEKLEGVRGMLEGVIEGVGNRSMAVLTQGRASGDRSRRGARGSGG